MRNLCIILLATFTLVSVLKNQGLFSQALDVLDDKQVWVNPDCGLKTRHWDEVKPALINMVQATKNIRTKIGKRT